MKNSNPKRDRPYLFHIREGSNDIIQAVILAGGKGMRLRPLTCEIPKVMIDINGRPFLQYVLELLHKKGISNIVLLVSYLGEQIEKYFGDGKKFGLDITYSYEDPPLGTGGALKKAERLLLPEFLLVNGDTYLDFDYKSLKNRFRDLDCKGLICVHANKDRKTVPNILLGEDKRVIRYDNTNPCVAGLIEVDAGAGIFRKEVLNLIPENVSVSFENEIYNKLIQEMELYGFPIENEFLDIGVFQRLNYARKIL